MELISTFVIAGSRDLFKLSPNVFLFNLTTFGLEALFNELFLCLGAESSVGDVELIETEFTPVLIDSSEVVGLLLILIMLHSVLAILLRVPSTVSSDFLKKIKSSQNENYKNITYKDTHCFTKPHINLYRKCKQCGKIPTQSHTFIIMHTKYMIQPYSY